MTPAEVEVAAARAHAHGPVQVEVSGGVTLATLRAYAQAGADLVVGAYNAANNGRAFSGSAMLRRAPLA